MTERRAPAFDPAGVQPFAMTRSVYIETFGCAFNVSDSETLEAILRASGWGLAPRESDADVVVLNSCTVKNRAYFDFKRRLSGLIASRARDGRPGVVVAGCAPAANPDDPLLSRVVRIGTNDLAAIPRAVEAALRGEAFIRLGRAAEARLDLPARRRNSAIEILPINKGCLSACSFCQTRLARGRLASFPIRDIVRRARRAIAEGVSEIWLTSQDTGAFGADIGATLPDLLEEAVSLPGEHLIRVGMSSPQWFHRDLDRLLRVYGSPRLFQFLHIPAQSGNDRVLRAMRRENSVARFEEVCAAFRARFPRIAIWTDIIAGFPTETEAEFEDTLELLRRTHPAVINRSKFSARPGTAAARMPQFPSRIVSERSIRLEKVAEEISGAGLAEWVGWEGEARISEIKRPGSAVARNFAYRPIVVRGDFATGERIWTRIAGHTVYHLAGEAVEPHPAALAG